MADSDQNFGKKLLSFFVKEEPAAPGQASAGLARPGASPAVMPPASPAPISQPLAGAGSGQPVGTVDSKFIDHFSEVLTKANQPGPDYFEFRDILRGLANLGLSEDKQFQAAWASFKAMGGPANVAALTQTAGQYLGALKTDRDAFVQSAETTLNERVGNLKTEQQRLQQENESLQKQLQEIQKRFDANSQRLGQIGGEMEEQSSRIRQNRANFEATHASLSAQIEADVQKITAYLK
jgi:hypothetical protein